MGQSVQQATEFFNGLLEAAVESEGMKIPDALRIRPEQLNDALPGLISFAHQGGFHIF
jgi:hypothetical protein